MLWTVLHFYVSAKELCKELWVFFFFFFLEIGHWLSLYSGAKCLRKVTNPDVANVQINETWDVVGEGVLIGGDTLC
jgi:hypothetical protein